MDPMDEDRASCSRGFFASRPELAPKQPPRDRPRLSSTASSASPPPPPPALSDAAPFSPPNLPRKSLDAMARAKELTKPSCI